eukprot:GGOE01061511.1.p1 GENE.GGOE01061511.1~~GGOE01061511.1.p1  ORF type:complete len:372 (+),score=73.32 GGOE01061511.1:44-1159(+)
MIDLHGTSHNAICLPTSPTLRTYCGLIPVCGHEFEFAIHFDGDGHAALLECAPPLQELMKGHEAVIQRRLAQWPSIWDFIGELEDIVVRLAGQLPPCRGLPSIKFYSRLVDDLAAIGWECVANVSQDMMHITCQVADDYGRRHALELHLPEGFPVQAPQCWAALPKGGQLSVTWTEGCSLKVYVDACQAALRGYRPYLDAMAELDANARVLEPDPVTPADVFRRIAVGQHSSMTVTVDPDRPLAIPEIRFLGAEHILHPLRDSLNRRLMEWDFQRSLLANLLHILGLEAFPQRAGDNSTEEDSAECGICYVYRLEAAIPDCVCDNPKCCRPYHTTCLVEWLRAIPSTRQSFDTLFGECVYCQQSITVKVPS